MAKDFQMKKIKEAENFIYKLLSSHPRTAKEIEDKLEKKGFKKEIIKQAMNHFINLGYLNDKEYIDIWLENQIKYRPSSRAFCFKKLKSLGLDENLINEALDRKLSEEKEFQIALKISEEKIRNLKKFSKKKQIEKLGFFLTQKGFPENVIWEILKRKDLID